MAKPKNAKGKNNTKEKKEKEKEVLSFTPTGRTISIYDIEAEVRPINSPNLTISKISNKSSTNAFSQPISVHG